MAWCQPVESLLRHGDRRADEKPRTHRQVPVRRCRCANNGSSLQVSPGHVVAVFALADVVHALIVVHGVGATQINGY